MMLSRVIFLQFLLQILGSSANIIERDTQQEAHIRFNHFWEAQHFINAGSLVEEESKTGEIIALRERRDLTKSLDKRSADIFSGSATTTTEEPNTTSTTTGPIINNCADCHQNATCDSAYDCTCNEGFSGNGTYCEEIIVEGCEPKNNPCSPNAHCNYTMGSVECTCNEVFYGDGKQCTEIRSEYSSSNVYIKPGEHAVLVCSLNETVQWKKDGNIVTNNANVKIFQNLLLVNSKDDNDYGEYFCEMRNYQGKGIKMRLIKINDDGNGSDDEGSTKFLIPFIIVLILCVCLLVVTVYLFLRRKPTLATTIKRDSTAASNNYATSDEIPIEEIKPGSSVEEPTYSSLSNIRDPESIYAPLQVVNTNETEYEDVSANNDDHIYAQAK